MLEPDSEEEDEFLTLAKERDIPESESDNGKMPELTKTKQRKIKSEGPFAGKNIKVFGADGKHLTKD